MATVTKPIALDESFNTTEVTPRNIADVLAEGLSHITGRTASEVEYDNTDSGLTADNVQDAIDEVNEKVPTLPSVDIQTAVDEFETYNGGLLSECKVALSPNQDLHGYDSPWVGGAGKNKANPDNLEVGYYSTTGYNNSPNFKTTEPIAVENGQTYSGSLFNSNDLTERYNAVLTTFSSGDTTNAIRQVVGESITIQSGESFIRIRNNSDQTPLIQSGDFCYQLEKSASATAYEPYSNICPISGHTQVEVEVSNPNLIEEMQDGVWLAINGTYSVIAGYCCSKKFRIAPNKTYNVFATADATIGTDNAVLFYDENDNYLGQNTGGIIRSTTVPFTFTAPSNAYYCALDLKVTLSNLLTAEIVADKEQVTVNLGGTYYSGTLDVVTGEFTPDTAIATVSDFAFTAGKSDGDLAKVEYTPSNFKNSIEKLKCNMMPYVEQSASWSETEPCYTIASGTKLRVYYDGDTLADFQADYADIQIIYELATPTPIQLSPTMVKALVGENHLSAPLDGQEITESKYKQAFTFDDVNAQIESTYSEGISHNSFYRGKYLGDHVTDEQWDAIGDGSFRDLYIGDYWAINGINWRIAHFNYWLGTGDVKCNTNHVVIVPYGWVSTFNMNASDDTTGGYLNSEWYTTNRHFAVENIEADFGASHILSHRNFFSDAVSDGHASHGMWVDSTVDLMNEIMVCGSLIGSYLGKYYEVGCDKFQLALFKYNPPSARMDVSYWLRGVSTASSFVAMGNFGLLDGFTASQILKIRPVFAIKK